MSRYVTIFYFVCLQVDNWSLFCRVQISGRRMPWVIWIVCCQHSGPLCSTLAEPRFVRHVRCLHLVYVYFICWEDLSYFFTLFHRHFDVVCLLEYKRVQLHKEQAPVQLVEEGVDFPYQGLCLFNKSVTHDSHFISRVWFWFCWFGLFWLQGFMESFGFLFFCAYEEVIVLDGVDCDMHLFKCKLSLMHNL